MLCSDLGTVIGERGAARGTRIVLPCAALASSSSGTYLLRHPAGGRCADEVADSWPSRGLPSSSTQGQLTSGCSRVESHTAGQHFLPGRRGSGSEPAFGLGTPSAS